MHERNDCIIFENDSVRVFYEARNAEFLLITFTPIRFDLRERFYAASLAEKCNFSIVGFVAKQDNWYPASYMDEALNSVAGITQKFATRVVFGVSMGGYAGIRYSRRLDATHVFALMPQWSINPAKSGDSRFQTSFKKFSTLLSDMEIAKEHTQGELTVVYDPLEGPDRQQIENLADSGIDIHRRLRAYSGRHALGPILRGSVFIERMLRFVVEGAPNTDFMLEINELLRKHPFRIQHLITHATPRHAALVGEILLKVAKGAECLDDPLYRGAFLNLLTTLSPKWSPDKSLKLLEMFPNIGAEGKRFYVENRSLRGRKIKTAHGNFVSYDLIQDDIILASDKDLENNIFLVPVYAERDHDILKLSLYKQEAPIYNIGNNKYSLSAKQIKVENPFLAVRKVENIWVISNGLFLATATPKGSLDFGATQINNLEMFYLD